MDETMPELRGCAFVRELHVLGNHLNVGSIADDNTSQHRGFGKRLIAKAEAIAKENRFKKIAIISGVGVRDYYRKQGYYLENSFMMKALDISNENNNNGYFSPARMILADIVIAIAGNITGDILQSFIRF
jgi:GNAT superfamily N-acetyltransferase